MGVTSYCFGHALFFVGVMADRLAMLAAVAIIINRRRRDVVKRLVGEAIGEEHGWICRDSGRSRRLPRCFLHMTHDQLELLTYVEPTIIGCDTKMRECITPHERWARARRVCREARPDAARGPGRAVVWRPAFLNIFAAITKQFGQVCTHCRGRWSSVLVTFCNQLCPEEGCLNVPVLANKGLINKLRTT